MSALVGAFICWAALIGTQRASAADYDQYDLSLRLPAAFSRFSTYASVTGVGNAQTGSEWSSSQNPASAAWPHPERAYTHSASAQFSALQFTEGTDLYAFAEAAVLDAGDWGVFVPVAAQVRTDGGRTSSGLGFNFDADYYQLQWGKAVADSWVLGANFNYTASATRFDRAGTLLARTRSDAYDLRLGVLQQPLGSLRFGFTVDYGWSPTWTDLGPVRSYYATERALARSGLVWRFAPLGTLYCDYQAGAFWNRSGTLWVHRFPLGAEYWLLPNLLMARLGTTVDTRGDAVVAAGVGIKVSQRVMLNFAHQYGAFPELRAQFGPCQIFALATGFAF